MPDNMTKDLAENSKPDDAPSQEQEHSMTEELSSATPDVSDGVDSTGQVSDNLADPVDSNDNLSHDPSVEDFGSDESPSPDEKPEDALSDQAPLMSVEDPEPPVEEKHEIELDVENGAEDETEVEDGLMSDADDSTEGDPALFDEVDMDDIFDDEPSDKEESDDAGEDSNAADMESDKTSLPDDEPLLKDVDELLSSEADADNISDEVSLSSGDEDMSASASSMPDESGIPEGESVDDELLDTSGISGDDLWEDDGESDDISLFEDMLIQEELAAEEQAKEAEEQAAQSVSAMETVSEDAGDEESADPDEEDREEDQNETDEDVEDDTPSILPWIITVAASLMTISGGIVLWLLMNSPVRYEPTFTQSPELPISAERPAVKQEDMSETQLDGSLPPKKAFDFTTLNISSFIIPVIKDGETVFLKLRVELILPDNRTLAALRKREAWVRDAIYMELKGITFEPGMRGDVLLRYRRPLLEKLRKEMAPLEIVDLRLSGLMLK